MFIQIEKILSKRINSNNSISKLGYIQSSNCINSIGFSCDLVGNSEVRGGVRVWFRGVLRVGVNSFCLAVFLITFKKLFNLLFNGVVILLSVDFIGDEMLYVIPSSLGA